MAADAAEPEAQATVPVPLSALLAQVLLTYTLEFESDSAVSLPLDANIVRVLEVKAIDIRGLPAAAAVSKEAISMALGFLVKTGFAEVDERARLARLTHKGHEARQAATALHLAVAKGWKTRFGSDAVDRLRKAMTAVLEQRDRGRMRLARGLEPFPDGWRASGRYLKQTHAILEDPATGLPAYPMVLHRGGWPDGS
jgi:hypothetical protein